MRLQEIVDQLTVVKAQLLRFGVQAVTSLSRPAAPGLGQVIYEGDTGQVKVYNGTEWNQCSAGGQLGYNQAVASQSGITAATDLTNLTVTVTVGTGRRIKISCDVAVNRTVADGTSNVLILEDSVQVHAINVTTPIVADPSHGGGFVVRTPTAGSHTWKLQLLRATGTGTTGLFAASNQIASILVEDIGPA